MGNLIRYQPKRARSTSYSRSRTGAAPQGALNWLKSRIGFAAVLIIGALALAYEHGSGLLREPSNGWFHAIDGDSLRLGGRELRLKGIDAPELHQTCGDAGGQTYGCGREAHVALKRLVDTRKLSCTNEGTDKYGRTLSYCTAGDLDINGEMVKSGWAVAYSGLGFTYWQAEWDARDNRRGLWQGTFEQPEAWRARHRKMQGDMTGGDD